MTIALNESHKPPISTFFNTMFRLKTKHISRLHIIGPLCGGFTDGRWLLFTEGQQYCSRTAVEMNIWTAILLYLNIKSGFIHIEFVVVSMLINLQQIYLQNFSKSYTCVEKSLQWCHNCVRESTNDRWIPSKRASNAKNVSIWWRHNVKLCANGRTWGLCFLNCDAVLWGAGNHQQFCVGCKKLDTRHEKKKTFCQNEKTWEISKSLTLNSGNYPKY